MAANKDILNLVKKLKTAQIITQKLMGAEAVKFFKKSFDDGGFTDNSLEKWKDPKRRERVEGKKRFKYKGFSRSSRTRAILVKSGKLKRAIRYINIAGGKVQIIADMPYANRHNNGEKGMPKRQFIGHSHLLDIKLEAIIKQQLSNALTK